jgi:urea transport system permease protein
LFVLGGLFIGVTLLLPRGIVGTLLHWWNNRHPSAQPADAPVAEPHPAE